MNTIQLTQDKVAIVDDEDYEWAIQYTWIAKEVRFKTHSLWYAARAESRITARVEGHPRRTIFMHRDLMISLGHDHSCEFDHRDGNGLNNRRSNLRTCVGGQNHWNRSKAPGRASKYKGVAWNKRDERWMSSIMCNKKDHHLGYFTTEEDAARAYDAAAKKHFGEFARLNLSGEHHCVIQ